MPQAKEFKSVTVLLTSDGKMESWIECETDFIDINGDVGMVRDCCGEERAEPEGKALNLPVRLHFDSELRS